MPRSSIIWPAAVAAACLTSITTQDLRASASERTRPEQTFTIENSRLRIVFDPGSGTYNLWDKTRMGRGPAAGPTLAGMSFNANHWSGSDPGYQHRGQ